MSIVEQLKELFKIYWPGKFDFGSVKFNQPNGTTWLLQDFSDIMPAEMNFSNGEIIIDDLTLPLTEALFDAVFFLTKQHLLFAIEGDYLLGDDRFHRANELLHSVFRELLPIPDIYSCTYIIPIYIIATVRPVLFAVLTVDVATKRLKLLSGTPDKYIRRSYKCSRFIGTQYELIKEIYVGGWVPPSPPLAIANFLLNLERCLVNISPEQTLKDIVNNPLLHFALLTQVNRIERIIKILSRTNSSTLRWKSLFNRFLPIIAALNVELEEYYDRIDNDERIQSVILKVSAEEIYNALLGISPEEAVKRAKEMIVTV